MTKVSYININKFLKESGLEKFTEITELKGGRNSKVYLIKINNESYIIKEYFKNNKNCRLEVEYNFLIFLNDLGLSNVPVPINKDEEKLIGLYSFLKGKKIKRPNSNHIENVAKFLKEINSTKFNCKLVKDAKESCFSISNHLNIVNTRLEKILEIVNRHENNLFLNYINKLKNKKNEIEESINLNFSQTEINKKISFSNIIISPSDFGFHNILSHRNKLNFIDFEYAGFDDPAKLICDFNCQPEIPISKKNFDIFIELISNWLPDFNNVYKRYINLLPLYRLKWCLIMLNEFTKIGIHRRIHSNNFDENSLNLQLNKSLIYYNKYLE